MVAERRYRCGECRLRTLWRTGSQGAEDVDAHYARRHPGIVAGGRVEVRRPRSHEGGGCLLVVGILSPAMVIALLPRWFEG
jgi:hypothetical protein